MATSYLRSLARVSQIRRISAAASYKPKVFYSTASEKEFEREMHAILQGQIIDDLKDVSDLETKLQKDINNYTTLLLAKKQDIENAKARLELFKKKSFDYVLCTAAFHVTLFASIGVFLDST
ncbi:hypothetical protein ABFS82_02G073800 [Erythranthe guttata]|uniref:Uncharacterized protein n=1 Tax=Erythranthe guttata TaxID=4155 RepID=A0A022QFZ5_ERYGU|nr:PREDICTED: uncharacterized protein LOC105970081 [Erythranthe guttata]EYU26474.1 hypothetical protein MIMGU_mgv1a016460mg [Erythranthe guttata]|eukprot:XP_012850320.1 PREDICTED: uncharacterized protein LOC105970081 [Erythranthe guttata]